MQHCDSTCSWCFREFIAWRKSRLKSQEREAGRSGAGSFNAAALTSVKPERTEPQEWSREFLGEWR